MKSIDEHQIDALTERFFSVFDNQNGQKPDFDQLRSLFWPQGWIVKNVGGNPEFFDLEAFITPRKKILTDGTLADFSEWETASTTKIYQNIAQRFSFYRKKGRLNGLLFEKKGAKSLHFLCSAGVWKICSVIWDDEI